MNIIATAPFRVVLLAGAGAALTPSVVCAQSAADPQQPAVGATRAATPSDAPTTTGVAEIIVTAQKRSENLQSVPISVSAVTSATLVASGVTNVESIAMAVPGITLTRQSAATLIYIRGIGTTGGQAGQEGAVATFVDGVYQPSMSGSTFAFNNIERIEVLKGPQGTLYGRNATGGAVNVITYDPSFTTTGTFDIGYGNRHNLESNAYISTGLSDTVAVNFAALYNNLAEGFGINEATGTRVNTRKDYGFRGKLLFKPSSQTKILLSGDYSRDSGSYGVSYRPVPGTTQLLLGPAPADDGNRYNIDSDVDPFSKTTDWGVSGRIEQEVGNATITSITAYRKLDQFQTFELGGSPINLAVAALTERNKQFTQELQIAGGKSKGFHWIGGLFYLNSDAGYDPFQLGGGLFATTPPMITGEYDTDNQHTTSYAAYGQATYPVTDRLNLTAGARYTIDKRKLDYNVGFTAPDGSVISGSAAAGTLGTKQATFKRPTWRFAIDYQVADDILAYASYSRGFKSGIYNLTAPLDPVVQPEKLDAFEVGLKTELFDRKLRLNVAGFYYKYDNIQLTVIKGAAQSLLNAAKAEVKGAEAEAEWAPTTGLLFHAGMEYIDGKYTDFPFTPVTTLVPTFPFGILTTPTATNGLPLINTPKFSGNATMDYSVPVSTSAKLGFNVAYQYSGKSNFQPDGRLTQPAYSLVNGSVRLELKDHITVRLWARNLFNQLYYVQKTSAFLGDLEEAAFGRQYGVSAGYKF